MLKLNNDTRLAALEKAKEEFLPKSNIEERLASLEASQESLSPQLDKIHTFIEEYPRVQENAASERLALQEVFKDLKCSVEEGKALFVSNCSSLDERLQGVEVHTSQLLVNLDQQEQQGR